MTDLHSPSRRELLLASGVLFAWAYLPKTALAEGRDPRLMVIVLRGALDGLATVAPIGDPDWVRLRGDGGLSLEGKPPALPLDNFFALHPAMPNLHRLYKAGQATILHAVATPYRERSHFDGQDVLESGMPKAGFAQTGWLNRAMGTLTPADRVKARQSAIAIGAVVPLVVRGPAQVMSWSPPNLPAANNDTLARVLDLYRHTDPTLAAALEERIGLDAIVGAAPMRMPKRNSGAGSKAPRVVGYFADQARAAAKFMSRPDGPRIGAISFEGWDTHANEGQIEGHLTTLLGALDGAIAAVEQGMGPAWRETVVVVATEFGRTAHINGTMGTDHGTATVALLAGGALKGGRVIADWPGVGQNDLFQGRDLKPTTDLRAALKGVLAEHLTIPEDVLTKTVFPGSESVRPLRGLLSA